VLVIVPVIVLVSGSSAWSSAWGCYYCDDLDRPATTLIDLGRAGASWGELGRAGASWGY